MTLYGARGAAADYSRQGSDSRCDHQAALLKAAYDPTQIIIERGISGKTDLPARSGAEATGIQLSCFKKNTWTSILWRGCLIADPLCQAELHCRCAKQPSARSIGWHVEDRPCGPACRSAQPARAIPTPRTVVWPAREFSIGILFKNYIIGISLGARNGSWGSESRGGMQNLLRRELRAARGVGHRARVRAAADLPVG